MHPTNDEYLHKADNKGIAASFGGWQSQMALNAISILSDDCNGSNDTSLLFSQLLSSSFGTSKICNLHTIGDDTFVTWKAVAQSQRKFVQCTHRHHSATSESIETANWVHQRCLRRLLWRYCVCTYTSIAIVVPSGCRVSAARK